MDETKFWTIIDTSWNVDPALLEHKNSALKTISHPETKDEHEPYIKAEALFLEAIRQQLNELTADDLLAFDRILERKLYDIDREDVHEFTDGSDDGFLYCRGYIVAIGKSYYDAINANPEHATYDCECESITYISALLYEEKFGEMPRSEICRETQSNQECW
ncbi:DUF4240 domain-containing protein [Planctomicrobium sp.]|jgi:hypothetical protein|nr:DUF4240 domain-containing protein [Planctomicrobium sp.]MDA7527823.1 DUF4240 domain-containing protein [bacterium]MDB4733236.1 DUF4240 domain-containing protein [Planctomicrobium sp.]